MILAVAGGKGGVGKSTVAYNLSAELDAVAVDGDLGMADLPAGRGPDLHDVLAGRADPLEAVCEDGPVTILPCGRSLVGARAADPTSLEAVVDAVEKAYGRVVIDCPAGMGGDAGVPLAVAEACVVVTTPRRAALTGALRTRALARTLDAGLVSVVVNRIRNDLPTGIERLFGAPATPIPDSRAVAVAAANGQPVGAVAPGSAAARAFWELADAVQSCIRS